MTQQQVLDMIRRNEGLRLHRYLDPPENTECRYAIGYGHTQTPHDHRSVITKEVAEELLRHDVRKAVEDVRMALRPCVGQGGPPSSNRTGTTVSRKSGTPP